MVRLRRAKEEILRSACSPAESDAASNFMLAIVSRFAGLVTAFFVKSVYRSCLGDLRCCSGDLSLKWKAAVGMAVAGSEGPVIPPFARHGDLEEPLRYLR